MVNYSAIWSQLSNAGGNATAMATAGNFTQWILATGIGGGVPQQATMKSFSDSLPNLVRYAMNIDLTGQGALFPQPVVVVTDAGPALTLSYRQRKGMVDVVLVPQYSSDLTNWTNVPAANIIQLPDDDVNTARYIAAMLQSPNQLLYLRVVALPNNSPVTQWPVSAGGNGHYYQAIVGLGIVDLRYAQNYAAALGGYVVTITSAEENAFVFNLVNAPQFWANDTADSYGPLLGANGVSVLQWVNNEGPLNSTYTNWASGLTFFPGNSYEGVQFFGTGLNNLQPTWNAFRQGGFLQSSFVVEFDSKPAGN